MEKMEQLQIAQAAFRSKSPSMFDVRWDSKRHAQSKKKKLKKMEEK